MAEPRSQKSGERAVALSQELSEFLIELSIALHRHGMYPQGHPSLLPAELSVISRLNSLVVQRGSLSLGVARRQLIIEGVATDPKHPVLQELAGRLHRHHIGAVRFESGADVGELGDFLRLLAVEADLSGEPLGLGDPGRLESWPHIKAYPLTYGRLEMVEETGEEGEDGSGGEGGARAARLWLGLARAALAAPADQQIVNEEPAAVAEAINRHERAEAYDQVIVGYMLQIAEELKTEGGASAVALRKRISSVIGNLTPETLERLVQMSGDLTQRRKFVADASRVFAVDAVVDVMAAAANATGQTISHSMLRMLNKLAAHADRGVGPTRAQADSELREQVRALVSGWELQDPNPDAYTRALHEMSRAAPDAAPSRGRTSNAPEPERLILMALEMGAFGDVVAESAQAIRREHGIGHLAELLGRVEADNRAVDEIWKLVTTVPVLEEELERHDFDAARVKPLVDRLGDDAVEPLLGALAEAESRSVRRGLMELLRGLGSRIVEPIGEWLARDERWYVQRNLLSLLAEAGQAPAKIDAQRYLSHSDERVRREAYRLLLLVPSERDRAVCAALVDADARNLRQGVTAAREKMPAAAVALVVQRLNDETLPSDLRVALIRSLEGTRSPLAMEALLRVATSGKALFGGVKIASANPETVAAIRLLARDWASHPRAADVLNRARKSRDPQLKAAAEAKA